MRFALRLFVLCVLLAACAPARSAPGTQTSAPPASTANAAAPTPQAAVVAAEHQADAPSPQDEASAETSPVAPTFVVEDAETQRERGAPIVIRAQRGAFTTQLAVSAVSSSEHVAIEQAGPVSGSEGRLFVVWLAESHGEDCREDAVQLLFVGVSADGTLRARGSANVGVDRNAFDAVRDVLDAQLTLEGDTVRIDTTSERTCARLDRGDARRDMIGYCEFPELRGRCRPFVRRATQRVTLEP